MNDGPGFVVNRLLAAMINQAFELLFSGVSAEQIDEDMRNFGFLGGPFEIIDTIGVDTCMYAGRTMWESGLTCVTLTPILPKLMKLGRLGRKTGVGIYRYPTSDSRARGVSDPEFAKIIAPFLVKSDQENAKREELAERIVAAMVNEGVTILEEDLVEDLRDIELCAIQGLSFPQHRGGIFFWADSARLSKNWLGDNTKFYDGIQANTV
jgi:3-hydroxyacyl-CoA dehydrogenase